MVNIAAQAVSVGGTVYQLTDPTEAAYSTRPTAWAPARIRWGTDDSLNMPDAVTLDVTLTVPDGTPLPAYGDTVAIAYRVEAYTSHDALPLFSGKIDGAQRHPWRAGSTRVDITAADDRAALARRKLSDEPWPDEFPSQRWDRVRALVADNIPMDQAFLSSGVMLQGRDVDNFAALEALRLAAAHTEDVITPVFYDAPILPNGGFETGDKAGWSGGGTVTDTEAHSGTYSWTKPESNYQELRSDPVDVAEGETWHASLWQKAPGTGASDGTNIPGAGVRLQAWDGSTWSQVAYRTFEYWQDWHQIATPDYTVEAGITRLRLMFYSNATITVPLFVDDVTLTDGRPTFTSAIGVEQPDNYGPQLVIPADTLAPLYITTESDIVSELPAAVVVDGPRTLSTGSVVTHAQLSYRERGIDDQGEPVTEDRAATSSNPDAARTFGDTRWNSTSDALYDPDAIPIRPDPRGPLQDRTDRIIAARSREHWALPEVEILLDRWPQFGDTIALRDPLARTTRLVRLTGAPPDLAEDPFFRVIGGELIIHPNPRETRLMYRLEPQAFAGLAGITGNDLLGIDTATFDRATNITADQLATVSHNVQEEL